MIVTELARAKINLSLRVWGKRSDGYHELTSLVAFASAGDTLAFAPGEESSVQTVGPFAGDIAGRNLIAGVIEAVRRADPGITLGRFTLTKNLPVASGIGGGSADAAAALRAIRAANPARGRDIDWIGIAATLGADVPVCWMSRAAFMTGVGHEVVPVDGLPATHAVLVNPRLPLSTAAVFKALDAQPLPVSYQPLPPVRLGSFDAMIDGLRAAPNDLQPPAARLCPAINEVIAALECTRGCALARLSGSGATCFGLYGDIDAATQAQASIAAAFPHWWVEAATLR